MRKGLWILLVLVLVLGAAAAAGSIWLGEQFEAPGPASQSLRVTVAPGLSVRGVARTCTGLGFGFSFSFGAVTTTSGSWVCAAAPTAKPSAAAIAEPLRESREKCGN